MDSAEYGGKCDDDDIKIYCREQRSQSSVCKSDPLVHAFVTSSFHNEIKNKVQSVHDHHLFRITKIKPFV